MNMTTTLERRAAATVSDPRWAAVVARDPQADGQFVYAVVVAVAFHVRVVLGEEPWLARTHGTQWEHYSSCVPRWFW